MRRSIGLAVVLLAMVPWCARAGEAAQGWRFYCVRDEIAPAHEVRQGEEGRTELLLAGNGNENIDGRWVKRLPVIGGRYYAFASKYRIQNVTTPTRSVLASVIWFDANGKLLEQPEYPATAPADADLWHPMVGVYQAPAKASEAQIELRLRWSEHGKVVFAPARLVETSAPTPRPVKVASINHRPRGTKSPAENLEQFARFVQEAAAGKPDIVCLPEGTTVCGTPLTYADVAESIPGPSTEFLGKLAAKHHAYIVAGIYEREGKTIYNTSVLMDRQGKFAGKYRKVCLPREEIDAGITPGVEYPVFDTDFGRIGMMICWDVHFPEVARELSARGAEIIFMPIWGGNETLAKARAIENQIYLVASGYDFRTAIYDRAGEELAKAPNASAVIATEIDLNQRTIWPWLGDWRSRIWREGPARADDR